MKKTIERKHIGHQLKVWCTLFYPFAMFRFSADYLKLEATINASNSIGEIGIFLIYLVLISWLVLIAIKGIIIAKAK